MSNVYYVGSEPLTFESIEQILTQNMKLELTPEVRDRIRNCRDYLDRKIEQQDGPLYGIDASAPGKIVLFGGGFPYVVSGEVVGGIGVSGGTVEQDLDIARYAMSL